MISPLEGLIGVFGFVLGFGVRTVLPFEYKRFRQESIESEQRKEEWTNTTKELLEEIRGLRTEISSSRTTDWVNDNSRYQDLAERISKHAVKAPESVDDDLVESVRELSTHIRSIPFVHKEFSVAFPDEMENIQKIPFQHEYESIGGTGGTAFLGRVIREMSQKAFEGRIMPLVEEIEDEIES